jgi:hypothetical protein
VPISLQYRDDVSPPWWGAGDVAANATCWTQATLCVGCVVPPPPPPFPPPALFPPFSARPYPARPGVLVTRCAAQRDVDGTRMDLRAAANVEDRAQTGAGTKCAPLGTRGQRCRGRPMTACTSARPNRSYSHHSERTADKYRRGTPPAANQLGPLLRLPFAALSRHLTDAPRGMPHGRPRCPPATLYGRPCSGVEGVS